MKRLRLLAEFAAFALLLSAMFVVPFLTYWFLPHPWDHVGAIVLGCFAFGGVVFLSSGAE